MKLAPPVTPGVALVEPGPVMITARHGSHGLTCARAPGPSASRAARVPSSVGAPDTPVRCAIAARGAGEADVGKPEMQQSYLEYLREEGFRPSLDGDSDIVFKMEMQAFFVIIHENDLDYIQVVLPNFWSIESPEERERAVKASERATAQSKVAKVYLVRDNVWASFEMFLPTPDSLKPVLPRALRALRGAARTFSEQMKEPTPKPGLVGIA